MTPPAATDRTTAPAGSRRVPRAALIVLCLLAAAFFTWRGPVRMFAGSNDLAVIFGSTRAWLVGESPYLVEPVDRVYTEAGGPDAIRPARRPASDLLYLPSGFAALSPIAAVGSWKFAMLAWGALNLASFIAGVWAIAKLAGWSWSQHRALVFLFLALVFAPVHTNFAHGQTGLIIFGLVAGAHGARVTGKPVLAGVMLGLAAALKPQLAAIFLAYEVFRTRWRVAIAGIATAALCLIIGVARLQIAGVDWLPQWQQNVATFAKSEVGSPLATNPYRYQLLNLHYPLHTLTDNVTLVKVAVYAIAIVSGVAFLLLRRGRRDPGELIALALASIATLIIVYHRFYDAALLLFPLGLAVHQLALRATKPIPAHTPAPARAATFAPSLGVLVGVLALAAPTASILFILKRDGKIPAALADSRLWESLLLPHQAWALLWIGVMLLVVLALLPREPASLTGVDEAPPSRA